LRLLDLFCGAGGAAMGYHRAGFEVVGVDIAPQPHYPFEFVQADALEYPLAEFDAIHASPPCQHYAGITALTGKPDEHPDLIAPVRERLRGTGVPYVIENVEGARRKMRALPLCGSSFGLDVRRHRYFETNWLLLVPRCSHHLQQPRFRSLDKRGSGVSRVVGVHGHVNYAGEGEIRARAMGIDWMTQDELVEAIPPAYTEFIGKALLAARRAA
jgi:DNA (cytosine-5)-methyltransferase 1